MVWRPLGAGLAGAAVLLGSGCSCHKRVCPPPPPPPVTTGAPCCPPGGAPVAPGVPAVPAPPAPAPQYYSGPPAVINGFGH